MGTLTPPPEGVAPPCQSHPHPLLFETLSEVPPAAWGISHHTLHLICTWPLALGYQSELATGKGQSTGGFSDTPLFPLMLLSCWICHSPSFPKNSNELICMFLLSFIPTLLFSHRTLCWTSGNENTFSRFLTLNRNISSSDPGIRTVL